ncbi:retrovirus-related pol polyprotein from transposon TNT 1-94 [Tanacetum coccineum]
MDEKINSSQKIQESKFVNPQPESSKSVNSSKLSQDSKPNGKNTDSSKPVRPKPLQKPKLKCELCHYTNHSTNDCYMILYCMKCKKEDHRTSDHDMYIASLRSSHNYKAQPYQNNPECEICGSYDHFTLGHNRVIQRHIREPIWYLDSRCSRSMTGVKSYLHKYVEQPGPKFDDKQGTIFNANKEIMLIASRRNDVYVLDMSSLTPNGACFFVNASDSDKPCSACEKESIRELLLKLNKISQSKKCLHLLMDLFGPVSQMSINHEKYTLVIVDEYSRVKQIRNDNGTEFRNSELERISLNFSSPYTPEQYGVTERKNRTLIEAARTMLNGSILSKHFWTQAARIACYTQNRSIIVKRHEKNPYEIFRERIPDISYFHVFGCHVFIHNHKDHLGKFDAKADDGYFLGYSFFSKAFNTRRQQSKETYHVTFDESMKAIRFANTLVVEIGIDDSSRYPPDKFLQEDDPSRQYQANSNISYYIISYSRSLTQENHVPEVIAPNEQDTPHIKDVEGPPDVINTEGTQEQNVQDEQINHQPTKESSRNNTKTLVPITETLVLEVPQSQDTHHASTSLYHFAQDRWSRDQHVEFINIIGDPGEGMLTRSMAAKLTAASARWVDAMQEELNQFYRNKVWTLVPLPHGKIAIGSKWVFRNKKDEHGIVTKNKARLVAQGYNQEEGIDYDETFAPPPGFKSSEFPDHVCKLDKALYGLKKHQGHGELTYFLGLQIKPDDKGISICQEQYTKNLLKKYEIFDSSSLETPMIPPKNLGPDLAGKPVNETMYRGMIGSLVYLTATRPDIQFLTCLCARYQASPKESHLIVVKRILKYLKGTPSLGLWYLKCSGFDLKVYSNSDYPHHHH